MPNKSEEFVPVLLNQKELKKEIGYVAGLQGANPKALPDMELLTSFLFLPTGRSWFCFWGFCFL
jgi:hypothetical protein